MSLFAPVSTFAKETNFFSRFFQENKISNLENPSGWLDTRRCLAHIEERKLDDGVAVLFASCPNGKFITARRNRLDRNNGHSQVSESNYESAGLRKHQSLSDFPDEGLADKQRLNLSHLTDINTDSNTQVKKQKKFPL
jgi:hypothetical protein